MSKSNYVLLFILEIHLSVFFARQFLLFEWKKMKLIKSSAWNELWLRLTLELFSKLNRPSHLKIHLCFFFLCLRILRTFFVENLIFLCWIEKWQKIMTIKMCIFSSILRIGTNMEYHAIWSFVQMSRKKSNKF